MTDILKINGVDEILITLLAHPNINQTQLEELSGLSNWKVLKLVPRLEDQGFIEGKRGPYNQKILSLTEKGLKVAQYLKKARDAASE